MVLTSPPSGENETLTLYKWQEKEVSSTSPGATAKVFMFATKATRKIKSLTELHATNLIPAQVSANDSGLVEYKYYDTTWKTGVGDLQMADCKVYIRKGGIDYIVSGVATSITSVKEGTTNIEVTFPQNVTANDAEAVLLSYAYEDTTNPAQSKFCVKDFDFKHSGRDYTSTQCISGVTYKRRQPLDLTEISLTTLKMGNSLSAMMLGNITTGTFNSISVKNMTGGNAVSNWALTLKVTDPANPKNKLFMIATNIGATSVSPKGGADSDLEETISFKTEPNDYCELEYLSS